MKQFLLTTNTTISLDIPRQLAPVHFPNLNGVRFVAAFCVLSHHIEQVKEAIGLPNIYDNYFIKHIGKFGVGLFFVLSGFLITYLLLYEKKYKNSVDIKAFYIRRMLRVWPLYFLIVLLSFFVFPYISLFSAAYQSQPYIEQNFFRAFSLFMMVLPNIATILYGSPYLCSQTWSVGVEEQFYLIWPWIIRSMTFKSLVRNTIITISLFSFIIVGLFWLHITFAKDSFIAQGRDMKGIISFFLGQFRILSMITGGFGAYLIFNNKEDILRVLFRRDCQYFVYSLLVLMLAFDVHFPGINMEVYGCFFCYIIINLAANPNTIVNLEKSWIRYLGKISYGLYIYHTAVIEAAAYVISHMFGNSLSITLYNILLYVSSIAVTILVSGASYQYLEKPFLTLKDRFSLHNTSSQLSRT